MGYVFHHISYLHMLWMHQKNSIQMTFTQPYDFMNSLENPDRSFSKTQLRCRGMLFISIENLMQRRTQAGVKLFTGPAQDTHSFPRAGCFKCTLRNDSESQRYEAKTLQSFLYTHHIDYLPIMLFQACFLVKCIAHLICLFNYILCISCMFLHLFWTFLKLALLCYFKGLWFCSRGLLQ